jgi:hypothetical protein
MVKELKIVLKSLAFALLKGVPDIKLTINKPCYGFNTNVAGAESIELTINGKKTGKVDLHD